MRFHEDELACILRKFSGHLFEIFTLIYQLIYLDLSAYLHEFHLEEYIDYTPLQYRFILYLILRFTLNSYLLHLLLIVFKSYLLNLIYVKLNELWLYLPNCKDVYIHKFIRI